MIQVPDAIKDLLHLDSCKKNIRIHFPNGEREDICNDLIVMNSVQFTESLCSRDVFNFGLCESPVFECEVVGVSNITGATIEVCCEIYCDSTVSGAEWKLDLEHYVYAIPYGTFVVDECKRQADMIHRKIIAYAFIQDLNNGLNDIEYAKLRFNQSANFTYTPSALYFSLANLGLKEYDTNYFSETEVASTGTYTKQGETVYWEISGEMYYATFSYEFTKWELSASDANALYSLWYDKISDNSVFTNIYNNLRQFGAYNGTKNYVIQQVGTEGMRFKIEWSGVNSRYVATEKDRPPFLFYPYLTGKTATIYLPNKISYVIHGPLSPQPLQASTTVISDKSLKKLTTDSYMKYMTLSYECANAYTVNFGDDFSNRTIFEDLLKCFGLFGLYNGNAIKFINIKEQFHLLPNDELYPDEDLYPEGVTGGKILPQDYQTCWYEDNYTKQYGLIRVYYINSGGNDAMYEWWLDDYDEDTDKSTYLVYELDTDNTVLQGQYTDFIISMMCSECADSIGGVTYIPVEFTGRGLPYVEPGDTFEILTASNDSITTIVLNRTLSGEQVLTDSYKSV